MGFTVKHRAADGTETLHSAETVEVIQNRSKWDDGIYLDWPPSPPHAPDEPTPPRLPAKHVIAIKTPYGEDAIASALTQTPARGAGALEPHVWHQPRVWIMNDAGSTVAQYDL